MSNAQLAEQLPQVTISAMREWLLDCYADEDSQDAIREASAVKIIRSVQREYAGGVAGFLADYNV